MRNAKEREAELLAELTLLQGNMESNMLDFPDVRVDKTGKTVGVKDTEGNAGVLFDHYNVAIAYNEMTKEIEIEILGGEFGDDTKANAQLAWLRAKARFHGMPDSNIGEYIEILANKNTYHPVRNWIDQREWDGVDRLGEWMDTVASTHPLKDTLMTKWALSAAASLYEKDFSTEGILIFIGKQGLGKTRWLSRLVKDRKWVKDGVLLDPKNKDSVLQAVSAWISELGELPSTFRKADIDQLKAFITLSRDDIRPAYAPRANKYKRQTVFFGTSNDKEILTDDENRRFWPLEVTYINYEHNVNMQQFWAQMKVMNAMGAERFLTNAEREALYAVQETDNRHISPVEERLENGATKPSGKLPGMWLNTTTILLEIGMQNPSVKDVKVASRWLKHKGFMQNGRREWNVFVVCSKAE
jgi:putative DNA primase/helicase